MPLRNGQSSVTKGSHVPGLNKLVPVSACVHVSCYAVAVNYTIIEHQLLHRILGVITRTIGRGTQESF